MNWNSIDYIKDTVARSRSNNNCPSCEASSSHYLINYEKSIVYCPCGNYQNMFTGWTIYKPRDKNESWCDGRLNIFYGNIKK